MWQGKMRRHMPWGGWAVVGLAGIMLASLVASFVWVFGWADSGYLSYVYLEHGMLCVTHTPWETPIMGNLPWYGYFECYRSAIYQPWTLLPSFSFSGPWFFRCPVHFPLLVLIGIAVYPILPFAVRRNLRKRGLCVNCGYDLRGSTSGVCSECGASI